MFLLTICLLVIFADQDDAALTNVPVAALDCVREYIQVTLVRTHSHLLELDCPESDNAKSEHADPCGGCMYQSDAVAMAWKLMAHGLCLQLISW